MSPERAEMAYIGREPCGCISYACSVDAPIDGVIEALQDMQRYNLVVEVVSSQYVRDNWRTCPHKPKPLKQATMQLDEVPQ